MEMRMGLRTAFDDFMQTTVCSLRGTLRRFDYVSRLRDPNGKYGHWGMAQEHGDEAAQAAMAQAHSTVFLDVLRTPVPELFKEFREGGQNHTPEFETLQELLPENLGGGSALHLKSVLTALQSLARAAVRRHREAA
jgi:hypothetical protein